MPDQINPAGRPAPELREAVRVHTKQIQDACIDKDCIEACCSHVSSSQPSCNLF